MTDLKSMSKDEIKSHIRELEAEVRPDTTKSNEELDAMTFFDWEDYIADLEKERVFKEAEAETYPEVDEA